MRINSPLQADACIRELLHMFTQEFIAQALGFLSYALGVAAFYQKDDKKLKIIMFIFSMNHLAHFLLLGSLVSAISALLSAVRTGAAIYVSSTRVAFLFIAVGLAMGIYYADSIWDMWSIFGMCIGTYAVFVLKGIQMRIAFLIGAGCWLINNIIVGSIGGTLLELTLISVNALTIWRLLKAQKQEQVMNKENSANQ